MSQGRGKIADRGTARSRRLTSIQAVARSGGRMAVGGSTTAARADTAHGPAQGARQAEPPAVAGAPVHAPSAPSAGPVGQGRVSQAVLDARADAETVRLFMRDQYRVCGDCGGPTAGPGLKWCPACQRGREM